MSLAKELVKKHPCCNLRGVMSAMDSVIERCAQRAEGYGDNKTGISKEIAEEIRSLKSEAGSEG